MTEQTEWKDPEPGVIQLTYADEKLSFVEGSTVDLYMPSLDVCGEFRVLSWDSDGGLLRLKRLRGLPPLNE